MNSHSSNHVGSVLSQEKGGGEEEKEEAIVSSFGLGSTSCEEKKENPFESTSFPPFSQSSSFGAAPSRFSISTFESGFDIQQKKNAEEPVKSSRLGLESSSTDPVSTSSSSSPFTSSSQFTCTISTSKKPLIHRRKKRGGVSSSVTSGS